MRGVGRLAILFLVCSHILAESGKQANDAIVAALQPSTTQGDVTNEKPIAPETKALTNKDISPMTSAVGYAVNPSADGDQVSAKQTLVATTKAVNVVSIVIMNWNRRDRLRAVLPRFNSMAIVHEIIISHGKEETKFTTPELAKVKHLDHWDINKSLGLLRRYVAGTRAERECVVYIDDDMVVPESAIETLYYHWLQAPDSVHGYPTAARKILRDSNGHIRYIVVDDAPEGEYPIILTQLAMTSKRTTDFVLSQSHNFEGIQREANPKPFWNGEDILLSLSAIHLNTRDGKPEWQRANRAWRCPGVYEDSKGVGISTQWPQHYEFRSRFTEAIVHYFSSKGTMLERWIN